MSVMRSGIQCSSFLECRLDILPQGQRMDLIIVLILVSFGEFISSEM